jgi:hypothetical protein
MRLFIDTANTDHIRQANDLGVICGVTTNPSLIAKEGRDFVEVVKEITEIVDGPISAEVISMEAEGMLKEAEELMEEYNNRAFYLECRGVFNYEKEYTSTELAELFNDVASRLKIDKKYYSISAGRVLKRVFTAEDNFSNAFEEALLFFVN